MTHTCVHAFMYIHVCVLCIILPYSFFYDYASHSSPDSVLHSLNSVSSVQIFMYVELSIDSAYERKCLLFTSLPPVLFPPSLYPSSPSHGPSSTLCHSFIYSFIQIWILHMRETKF